MRKNRTANHVQLALVARPSQRIHRNPSPLNQPRNRVTLLKLVLLGMINLPVRFSYRLVLFAARFAVLIVIGQKNSIPRPNSSLPFLYPLLLPLGVAFIPPYFP